MPFRFEALEIPGVVLVEPVVFSDERGFFMETYKHSSFAQAGVKETFVQSNHSSSGKRVLRGLHFQKEPMGQGKLVRVLVGEIFDVAVDIQPKSPTFRQWVSVVLSAENKLMLYIPPWCAHGFCVLSDNAEVEYQTTREYAPEYESGLLWNDPDLAIKWPVETPLVAAKDLSWPTLRELGSPLGSQTQ